MAFVNLAGVWFTVGVERMGTVLKAVSLTLVQAALVQHIPAPPLLGEKCVAMGARTTASTRTRNIRQGGGTRGRLMYTASSGGCGDETNLLRLECLVSHNNSLGVICLSGISFTTLSLRHG